MVARYAVAEPNSYLIVTGMGISGCKIEKKCLVLPFQKVTKISITPFDFSLSLQAMTMEKLKFSLPAVFTVGPQDTLEAIRKYATLLTGESDGSPAATAKRGGAVGTGRNHVQEIVKGIIEGETRSIVSTMSMEELFRERQVFKNKVIANVQSELDQFGLCIYNANIRELQDSPGSEYFNLLSRKAHEGASNQAKIDVADARSRGEIGEAEKQGKAKQEIARINAATAVLETERKGEKATADAALTNKEIAIEKELKLARISATRTAEMKDAELQTVLEVKRADMELEKQRATTLVAAKIARESAEEKAQADLYKATKAADAEYAKSERDTNALVYRRLQEATSLLESRRKEAEAKYLSTKAEADGIRELAGAYTELSSAFGGPAGLLQYLMLREGTYEKLARANASAIQGLQPKISVWNTGNTEGGAGDAGAVMRNIFQHLPPLLSTIEEQTGIRPPSWLVDMPRQQNQQQKDKEGENKLGDKQDALVKKMVNGTS